MCLKALYAIYNRFSISLIAIICVWSAPLNSQSLKFEQLSSVDDNAIGKINSITQDAYGFMWFSDQTNRCLYRFDGSHLTKFPYDPSNPNGLGSYYPEYLAADEKGGVWVALANSGLDYYNPQTNHFKHFKHEPDNPNSLISNSVQVILVDHLGMVWVGTVDGLSIYDPNSQQFTNFKYEAQDPKSISHNQIRIIYEDRERNVWVGTGYPWELNELGGLNKFDRKTETFTRYLNNKADPNSIKDNKIRAILEDSKGNLWVGTRQNGLHRLNRTTGEFDRIGNGSINKEELRLPEPVSTNSHITFLLEDLEGFLWIGTFDTGILRWDPNLKTMDHFGAGGVTNENYTENSSWAGYVAKDGQIWISTQENKLFKIDPYKAQIEQVPQSEVISAFLKTSKDQIWTGTFGNGLIIKDIKSGRSLRYKHDNADPHSLSDDSIKILYEDREGLVWVGTKNGLNRYEATTKTFTSFPFSTVEQADQSNENINSLIEDHAGNLWIATQKSLNKLNRKTAGIEIFPFPTDKIESYTTSINAKIVIRPDKKINVSLGQFLYSFDPATKNYEFLYEAITINQMYYDKKGNYWQLEHGGLFWRDPELDSIVPYKIPETGIYFGEWGRSFIADDQDNIWIGSDQAIIKLGADRQSKEVFDIKNGVTIQRYSDNSYAYKDSDGKIYFASSPEGYYTFDPDEFKTAPGELSLYFQDLRVNNLAVRPGADSPLQSAINEVDEIRLKFNENSFSLHLTAIDFRTPFKRKIQYRLEGFETEWNEILSGQKIIYNKVAPGTYTLKAKTKLEGSGKWLERSLLINVAKPWYNTIWAYCAYIILVLLSIFLFDKYRKERIIEKERALIKDRQLAQAKEIEKAYTSLKATQEQLIHSEKMASLGELTAGIAHEIKNPLNFINNFSEVTMELVTEMMQEVQKGDKAEANDIAGDIVQNLDKIVYHGKRADDIVKGMLHHSRKGDGQKELTDINKLCDEYLRLAYHGLRAKDKSFNARMETDFDKSVGQILIIPQDIGRVVLNLLTNAFYAVSNKAKVFVDNNYDPTVVIKTRKINGAIEIIVIDNGDGIPASIKNKIFQPFFTTKPTGQGTGLGLSMSYDIVTNAHGGKLELTSEEGLGSTFVISLPEKQTKTT